METLRIEEDKKVEHQQKELNCDTMLTCRETSTSEKEPYQQTHVMCDADCYIAKETE